MTTGRFPHWEPEPEPPPRRGPSLRVLVALAALNGAAMLVWSCATMIILARIIGAPDALGYALALPVGTAALGITAVLIRYVVNGGHN